MAEPKFGELYVHIDEDGNAVSVAKHGGKPGAWRGISIARMGVPDEHKSQEEINGLAHQFAASSDMLAELRQCAVDLEEAAKLLFVHFPGTAKIYAAACDRVNATIAKAARS